MRWLLTLVGAATLLAPIACGGSSKGAPTGTIGAPTQTSTPAISASTPQTIANQPPNLLARLPEGKLVLVRASGAGPDYPTFVIQGDRATASPLATVPGEDSWSADRKYLLRFERTATGQPTALVVRQADGTEVFRLALSSWTPSAGWSPADRIAYQVGQTLYIRNVDTGDQTYFQVPAGVNVRSWLAGGSELLLIEQSSGTDRHLYVMDAISGAISKVPLPPNAWIGPGAEFASISPDARYISYPMSSVYPRYDLWLMEIATGRICLVMKDSPYTQQRPETAGWSPDSHWLTYATTYLHPHTPSEFAVLRVFDPKTCADQAVSPDDAGNYNWSPQGQLLAVMIPGAAYNQFSVKIWHPHGPLLNTGLRYWPNWSPDGTMLASVAQGGVQIADAETGRTTEYYLHNFPATEGPGLYWSPSGRYLLVFGERPEALTPSSGESQMYILDRRTGTVSTLVDEHHQDFAPTAWLP